jgi:hypothetical protein
MASMTLLHVVFGTIALVVAPLALAVRKGGTWHRRWGKAFVWTMAVVLFSAGFLWQAKGHLFLVPLGAITAYLLFNGTRVIARRKRRRPDEIDDRADRLAAYAAIAAAASTVYLGASGANPLLREIGPALIGIGGIGLAFGLNELLGFREPRSKPGWLLAHFSAMIAAYASAVTAFVVINAHAVPMMLRWGVPVSLAGLTIAVYALRYVRLTLPFPLRGARPGAQPVAAATPPAGSAP